jgi:hypothetical protein
MRLPGSICLVAREVWLSRRECETGGVSLRMVVVQRTITRVVRVRVGLRTSSTSGTRLKTAVGCVVSIVAMSRCEAVLLMCWTGS